jgi:hypothetical protein
MRLSEEMLGGWGIGTRDSWPLLNLLDHIAHLKDKYGYKNIVFCGSSLGGYMALQLDILAQSRGLDVGSGGAYAENPQTNLFTYLIGRHIDLLASVGFSVPSRDFVPEEFRDRFDVGTLIDREGFAPRGLLVIKESDTHHYKDQLPHLTSAITRLGSKDLTVEVIPAADDPTGHTPLTLEQMTPRIEALLNRRGLAL